MLNRRKLVVHVILSLVLILSFFGTLCSSAEELDESLTVYASTDEREAVYEALLAANSKFTGTGIDWETLSPMYYYNMLNFELGNTIVLDRQSFNGNYNYTVNRNSVPNGETLRTIMYFHVENGIAKNINSVYIDKETGEKSYGKGVFKSQNYADYAEEIMLLLGRVEIIDPVYVRLVYVEGLGNCFYINDGTDECFITAYATYEADAPIEDRTPTVGVIHVGEELLEAKEAYAEWCDYMAEVQKNGGDGGGEFSYTPETTSDGRYLTSITDVEGYFGESYSLGTHFPEAFRKTNHAAVWIIAGTVAAAGAVTAVTVIVRKKRKAS